MNRTIFVDRLLEWAEELRESDRHAILGLSYHDRNALYESLHDEEGVEAVHRELDVVRAQLAEARLRIDELSREARERLASVRAKPVAYVCIVCGHEAVDPLPPGGDAKDHGNPRPDGRCSCCGSWMSPKRPGMRILPLDVALVVKDPTMWSILRCSDTSVVSGKDGERTDLRKKRPGWADDGTEDIPF